MAAPSATAKDLARIPDMDPTLSPLASMRSLLMPSSLGGSGLPLRMLVATFVAVALAFAPRSTDAFATPKLAALIVGSVAVVVVSVRAGGRRVGHRATWLVFAAGALVFAAPLLVHGFDELLGAPYFRHGSLMFLCLAVVAWTASVQVWRESDEYTIGAAVSIVAGLLVAYSWIQAGGLDPFDWSITSAPIATVGNPTSLACLSLMIAGYLAQRVALHGTCMWGKAVVIFGCGSVAGLSGSRAAILVAVALALVAAFGLRLPQRLAAAALLAGLVAGSFGSDWIGAERITTTRLGSSGITTHSDEVRFEIWSLSLDIIRTNAWLGVGSVDFAADVSKRIDQSTPQLLELRDANEGSIFVNDPHSLFLEYLAFYGMLPLVTALSISVWWLRGTLRAGSGYLLAFVPLLAFGAVNPLGIAEYTLAALLVGVLKAQLRREQAFPSPRPANPSLTFTPATPGSASG